jgi:hypothetical protein
MASLRTAASVSDGGQGIIRILKISACVTGDTVSFKNAVKGWQVVNRTTADAVTATYNATTQLFTITVANTPDIDLWIVT